MIRCTAGALFAAGAASTGYFWHKERLATAAIRENKLTVQPISCSRTDHNFSTIWIGSPYTGEGTICRIIENVEGRGPIPLVVKFFKPDVSINGSADHPAVLPVQDYARLCGRIRPLLDLVNHDPAEVLQNAQRSWEEKELKSINLGHVAKMEGLEEAEKALPDDLKEKIPYFVDAVKMQVILARKLPPEDRTSQLHRTYALGPNPCGQRVEKQGTVGFVKAIDNLISIETDWGSLEIGKHENLAFMLLKMNRHFHKRRVMLTAKTFHGRHFLCCNSRGEKLAAAAIKTRFDSDEAEKIKKDWTAIRDIVFYKAMREMEKSKKQSGFSNSIRRRVRENIISWLTNSL